ncbi:short-chain dehydrogenase/reductase [Xylariomycetidae sp. FL0641]|nr:short-chain dehydrogenase/reductase [Xylariomycetidae sp. FL0641]
MPPPPPQPRTVLITGCGPGGIGAALATAFHARGHRVLATDRAADALAPLAARGIATLALDVTSAASVAEGVARARVLLGCGGRRRLDVLVNNAGLLHMAPFADTDVAQARRLLEVNVLGAWAVTQAFLPLLREGRGGQGGGEGDAVVAVIGSINEVLRPPYMAAYNASKAAVEALASSIRPELAPLGVRVVTVKTGAVRTGLWEHAPVFRLPEDSVYLPAREFIEGRKMLEGPRYMDVDVYADRVVEELLRPRVKCLIWQGGLTTIAWLLSWFGWEGMLDNVYIRGNQLNLVGNQM